VPAVPTNQTVEDELRLLPPALTVEQAARLLRIGRSKAYQAVQSGEWPTRVLRVGRCIRIPTAEVLRLLGLPSEDSDKEQAQ
jgi:excisionase family DNA binding protein